MKLRPYQKRAIDALRKALAAKAGNQLVVLPPGTGKSLLVAELIRSARKANPNARILVLTASKELVVQNADELRRLCPDETVSMYNAALGLREASGMVIFGTIQSIYSDLWPYRPGARQAGGVQAHGIYSGRTGHCSSGPKKSPKFEMCMGGTIWFVGGPWRCS